MKEVTEIPFDLYGELEDVYDNADFDGDVEIVETLDTFGIWDEHPKCDRSFLYKIWQALKGDVVAEADVGHAFYWCEHDPKEKREEYKWLDRPELAIYWYERAAEAGYADAQNDLACLYCPKCLPFSKYKIGRFARYWWEEAAAQKLPEGMRGLAHCLRCSFCGNECYCDRDIPRAEALVLESYRLPAMDAEKNGSRDRAEIPHPPLSPSNDGGKRK